MKKKWMVLAAAAVVAGSLAACSGGSGETNANADAQAAGNQSDTQAPSDGSFPNKTIEMIVPFGAGGGADIATRLICSYAEKELGQSIVINNVTAVSYTHLEYSDYTMAPDDTIVKITATGHGAHAAQPEMGNNALTGLLSLISILPFEKSEAVDAVRKLSLMFPHGDFLGEQLGIAMKDDISGPLTLAFSMLEVGETGLERCV